MGLTQMNNQPTRKENILDLYFTNSPTLVRHMEMIPGIGDHDSAIKLMIAYDQTNGKSVQAQEDISVPQRGHDSSKG